MKNTGDVCFVRKEKTVQIYHYVRECNKMKVWFRKLGSEEGDILGKLWGENLDRLKGEILKKLCKNREKKIRKGKRNRER